MARLNDSLNFEEQVSLLTEINKKVTADAGKSPLLEMLKNQGIVLSDDIAAGVEASKSNDDLLLNHIASEKLCKERDLIMDLIMKDISVSYQFLKGHYTPVYKTVGEWGATITNSGRVSYPTTTQGEVKMLGKLKAQHESFKLPAISPLAAFLTQHSIDLVVDTTKAAVGLAKDSEMNEKKVAGFICREHRDNIWKLPLEHIRIIGAFLMKFFKGDASLVGEYGFNVIVTPKVNKTKKVSIAYSQSKLKMKIAIGSEIINNGTETINIYKGKIIEGTPLALAVGKKWTVGRGYSTLSVENTSDTDFAKFSVSPPIV